MSISPQTLLCLHENDGASYWQPEPTGGYVTVKVSPHNSLSNLFAFGIQVVPPGGAIPEHAHERNEEMLYVRHGSGRAIVDGHSHEISKGATVVAGRQVLHTLINDGEEDLEVLFFITPPGLEDFLAGMGTPRSPGDEVPTTVEYPDNFGEILTQVRFSPPVGENDSPPIAGPAFLIAPEEGDTQESLAGDRRVSKVQTTSVTDGLFAMELCTLDAGVESVGCASGGGELLHVLAGTGSIVVGDSEFDVAHGTTFYDGSCASHRIVNAGTEALQFLRVAVAPAAAARPA